MFKLKSMNENPLRKIISKFTTLKSGNTEKKFILDDTLH